MRALVKHLQTSHQLSAAAARQLTELIDAAAKAGAAAPAPPAVYATAAAAAGAYKAPYLPAYISIMHERSGAYQARAKTEGCYSEWGREWAASTNAPLELFAMLT